MEGVRQTAGECVAVVRLGHLSCAFEIPQEISECEDRSTGFTSFSLSSSLFLESVVVSTCILRVMRDEGSVWFCSDSSSFPSSATSIIIATGATVREQSMAPYQPSD